MVVSRLSRCLPIPGPSASRSCFRWRAALPACQTVHQRTFQTHLTPERDLAVPRIRQHLVSLGPYALPAAKQRITCEQCRAFNLQEYLPWLRLLLFNSFFCLHETPTASLYFALCINVHQSNFLVRYSKASSQYHFASRKIITILLSAVGKRRCPQQRSIIQDARRRYPFP